MSENNYKIRIKFRKYDNMRFVGHLDTMRYFQKAMRRADIPIAYSEGFSPHQIMSFAAPLGVGVTSDGEYMDIEATALLSSDEAVKRLNSVMVPGIDIVSYKKLPEKAANAMSSVACADYILTLREGHKIDLSFDKIKNKIKEFYFDSPSIIVEKKTKKNVCEIDLKTLLYQFEIRENKNIYGDFEFYIKCATGSVGNIKPDFVISTFYDYCGLELNKFDYCVHRIDVYTKDENNRFISLGEIGAAING